MNIKEFIRHNPEYEDIIKRAVEEEEKNKNNHNYLGWEWDKVRAYPARLMKLVTVGIARINYKSNRYTSYLLENREAVKEALKK
jgi:hypothetical protein